MTTQTATALQQNDLQQEFNAPASIADHPLAGADMRNQLQTAMMPKTFADVMTMSEWIANSDLAPKDFKGKPGNVMIAWQTAISVGIIDPLQAIQNIAIINGRPAIWGDMMLAICRASPAWSEADFAEWIEGEGLNATAYCTVRRRSGQPVTQSFSMQDAKAAGLAGKQGPWTQYPKRMLQMRARSFALRDTFTPELKGMRMVEEERDITAESGQPVQQSQASPQQRAGTAGKVGSKLAEQRAKRQSRQVYEATVEQQADTQPDQAEQSGVITCAYVCDQINKAATPDELAEAIDLARHVPEEDRGVVNEAYKARVQQLKAAAAKQE
ncbi:hypothetical protein GCM10027040_27280 [Halomonas shantousis]